jgi:hypothetical protein
LQSKAVSISRKRVSSVDLAKREEENSKICRGKAASRVRRSREDSKVAKKRSVS